MRERELNQARRNLCEFGENCRAKRMTNSSMYFCDGQPCGCDPELTTKGEPYAAPAEAGAANAGKPAEKPIEAFTMFAAPDPITSAEDVMIMIGPTPEFFLADVSTMVRAWKGRTNTGHDVVALVAGLQLDLDDPAGAGLKAIPPPVPEWTPVMRAIMGNIWAEAARLSDKEGMELLAWVTARALYRDDNWVEALCDHCQQPYRGPAVYCCLACAQADAR